MVSFPRNDYKPDFLFLERAKEPRKRWKGLNALVAFESKAETPRISESGLKIPGSLSNFRAGSRRATQGRATVASLKRVDSSAPPCYRRRPASS